MKNDQLIICCNFYNLDYKISDWKENEEGILERVESYLFPLNNPIVRAKETECYVTLKLSKNIPGRYFLSL